LVPYEPPAFIVNLLKNNEFVKKIILI
jgi:hypothetical protein